ncbi:histidine kinase [Skermanella stibiiresistens SB22]|uniref:Histidine kinase n=1 Tax=Skermanella stibiiresistens SB22 TaxID=1385369 RepID=W9HCR5_9PROT|nr:response regulator [Skermanella stibiiresistens]EWY41658.1 histidine kinase [Skermanella stibiiresistens SB22]
MRKILVVEDDRTYRTIMVKALSRAGYLVSEAISGVEVITLLKSDPPDAIVTDILMPDMDGLELIRMIRAMNRDIVIIAVSGGAPNFDFLPAAALFGANATMRKPLALGELIALVQSKLDGQAPLVAAE